MLINNLPDIYFIRHGETSWNKEGRYQGRTDIALNDTGLKQAKNNGILLQQILQKKRLNPSDFTWVCSPLSRTKATMENIRSQFKEALPKEKIDERLIELSFGVCEGFLHDELVDEFSKRGERGSDFWNFRAKDAESYQDASKRIVSFINEIEKPTIIVSHGGVARVFRHLIEDLKQTEAVNWATPQDAILHFSNKRMQLFNQD